MSSKTTKIDEIWLQDITLQLGRYILTKKQISGQVDEKLYDIFLALTELLDIEDEDKEEEIIYGDPEI